MVKLTRGQEVKIITSRQLSEELQRRKEWRFPNCTEIYTECRGRIEPCITCPYREGYKMGEIKKLEESEYSEDRKKAVREAEENRKIRGEMGLQVQQVETRKVEVSTEKRRGISGRIKEYYPMSEDEMYNRLKQEFQDRDEKYLRMRIKTTIDYFKKRGELI